MKKIFSLCLSLMLLLILAACSSTIENSPSDSALNTTVTENVDSSKISHALYNDILNIFRAVCTIHQTTHLNILGKMLQRFFLSVEPHGAKYLSAFLLQTHIFPGIQNPIFSFFIQKKRISFHIDLCHYFSPFNEPSAVKYFLRKYAGPQLQAWQ